MTRHAMARRGTDSTTIIRERGFSLIELLVVISIAGILLAIGVPNLQSFLVRDRLAAASNELHTTLQTARSEAMKRNQTIVLAPNTADGSGNWSGGWRMFVDLNNNGALDPGEEVLRNGAASDRSITLYGSSNLANRVSFLPSGGLRGGAGHFVICANGVLQENGQSRSRALLINTAGRVRAGIDSNGNGIPETDTGELTSCTRP